jgi:hypothetical protein
MISSVSKNAITLIQDGKQMARILCDRDVRSVLCLDQIRVCVVTLEPLTDTEHSDNNLIAYTYEGKSIWRVAPSSRDPTSPCANTFLGATYSGGCIEADTFHSTREFIDWRTGRMIRQVRTY